MSCRSCRRPRWPVSPSRRSPGDLLRYFDATGSSGVIDTYSWNFGDGNSNTGQTPSHGYANAGTYTVTLTVTGPGGSHSTSQTTTAGTADTTPVASFSVSVNRYRASFTSSSTGSNLLFGWDVDGDTFEDYSTQNPTHTYASSPATHRVTLTVSNGAGSHSISQDVNVPGFAGRQFGRRPSSRSGARRWPLSGGEPAGGAAAKTEAGLDLPLPARAHIVVSNVTPTTQCQEVSGYVIGNEAIAAAAIYAVDIWGWVQPNTQVCFARPSGSFKFIDTTPLPRVVYDSAPVGVDGMICHHDRPAGHGRALAGPAGAGRHADAPESMGSPAAAWCGRSSYLNLRSSPGGPVIGAVPYDVTLTAMARTADWFKVDYLGTAGWVSNGYLEAKGNCG